MFWIYANLKYSINFIHLNSGFKKNILTILFLAVATTCFAQQTQNSTEKPVFDRKDKDDDGVPNKQINVLK